MGEQTVITEASRVQNVKKAQLPGDSRLGWFAFPECVCVCACIATAKGCIGKRRAQRSD